MIVLCRHCKQSIVWYRNREWVHAGTMFRSCETTYAEPRHYEWVKP